MNIRIEQLIKLQEYKQTLNHAKKFTEEQLAQELGSALDYVLPRMLPLREVYNDFDIELTEYGVCIGMNHEIFLDATKLESDEFRLDVAKVSDIMEEVLRMKYTHFHHNLDRTLLFFEAKNEY